MVRSTYFCAYFLFMMLLSSAATMFKSGKPILKPLIVGGTPTTIYTDPHMVQIWTCNNFTCAGSLLNEWFVLTAAHCFNDIEQDQITVIGNVTNLGDEGIKRKVQFCMIPKGYNSVTWNLDVATLKLDAPMTGCPTIPLFSGALTAGMPIRVSGWGRTSESGELSTQLRTATVNVIDRKICQTQYLLENLRVTDAMFCAGSLGKDSCAGDSGGPATCDGKIVGIVSWGLGCARDNYPGVYTLITYVKPFIENSMLL